MSRRDYLAALAASGLAAPALRGNAAGKKPNILLILSDDQGYGDLSLHGNPFIKTRNIDQFAKQSVELTRFYVSPVCAPTRSSLLTGRYHLRTSVHDVTSGLETMRTDETTLAEALRAGGYKTALMGKWHLGTHYPYVPHAQGFDDFIGFRTGHWINYFDSHLEHNGKPMQAQGFISDFLTGQGKRFIDSAGADPFFLYMAYNLPHTPAQAPERYFDQLAGKPITPYDRAIYSMVGKLDDNVGALLAHLESRKLAENTIVIFLSDNGPNGLRFNDGFRGKKGGVYEGGIRVPFFMRWPGHLQPGRKVDAMAAHIDIYPTLLSMSGVGRPHGLPIDGVDLSPVLKGTTKTLPNRFFFSLNGHGRPSIKQANAVRDDRYALINRRELYDLSNDVQQQHDIAPQHPDTVRRMASAYEKWFGDVTSGRSFDAFPIPIGYAEEDPVFLPAPEAELSKGLHYSDGHGYAHSRVVDWTGQEEEIRWNADVVRAGMFRFTIKYLCPQSDLGSVVQLTAGGEQLRGKLLKATSMEPIPEKDLYPREEDSEMHWTGLQLGELKLETGKQEIRLSAVSKANGMVMQLQGVSVERVR